MNKVRKKGWFTTLAVLQKKSIEGAIKSLLKEEKVGTSVEFKAIAEWVQITHKKCEHNLTSGSVEQKINAASVISLLHLKNFDRLLIKNIDIQPTAIFPNGDPLSIDIESFPVAQALIESAGINTLPLLTQELKKKSIKEHERKLISYVIKRIKSTKIGKNNARHF